VYELTVAGGFGKEVRTVIKVFIGLVPLDMFLDLRFIIRPVKGFRFYPATTFIGEKNESFFLTPNNFEELYRCQLRALLVQL
jgi:hypothetical protein